MAGAISNNPQLQQARQLGQGLQQPGQVPQTANVDFGFNPTQNVPFRPQQIPGNQVPYGMGGPAGVAYNPAYAQYENPMSSEQLQQWIAQLPPMPGVGTTYGLGGQPYPGNAVQGAPNQGGYNPAPMSPTPMPANYTGPATQPQIQPPRPTVIQPGPNVFPQPRPQDLKRGRADRNLQPVVLQGLAGLMNRR